MPKYRYSADLINLSDPRRVTTKIIGKVGSRKRVLELGCNNGYMSRYFCQKECEVWGIDIDEEALGEAKQFCYRTIAADLNAFEPNLLQESFDCIVASDVLEHLIDPRSLLEKLRPWLKPNGTLVASIPNITHASLAMSLLRGQFDYKPSGLADESHYRFFSEQSIYHLFESAGYFICSFDRVFAGMGTTEFDRFAEPIAQEIIKFVQANKNAIVYQFVVEARPCTEAQTVQKLSRQIKELSARDGERLEQSLQNLQVAYGQLEAHYLELQKNYRTVEKRLVRAMANHGLYKMWERLTNRLLAWMNKARLRYLSGPIAPKILHRMARYRTGAQQTILLLLRRYSAPSYHPKSWGSTQKPYSLKILLLGSLEGALPSLICQALAKRANEVFVFSLAGKESVPELVSQQPANYHVILSFDKTSIDRLDAGLAVPPATPLVFCLADPQSSSLYTLSTIAKRHPEYQLGVCGYNTVPGSEQPASSYNLRYFKLNEQFENPEQKAAFLAVRLEEKILDLLQLRDPVLERSQQCLSKRTLEIPFARPAIVLGEPPVGSNEVTTVIPTFNAGPDFEKTLKGIRSQRLYGKCPILVVDSGSTDETLALAAKYGAEIFSVRKSEFNHGLTRDLGISKTRTPFVFLLVQDAVPVDSETIANLARHFSHPAVAGVYTCSLPVPGHDLFASFEPNVHRAYLGPYAKIFQISDPHSFDSLDYTCRLQFCRFDNVCSMIRKHVWESHQFGKLDFAEDIAWAKKVLLAGHAIAYDPFSRVIHSHMRHSQYIRHRAIAQSVTVSDIIAKPEANYSYISFAQAKQAADVFKNDLKTFKSNFEKRINRTNNRIFVGDLRKELRNHHVFILKNRDTQPTLEHFRFRLPLLLGLLFFEKNDSDPISHKELDALTDKVGAAVEGALWGDYASSWKLLKTEPPSPELLAIVQEAANSV
ncbi:MAG: methyltransferase domain-containing protein [Deltaproteobacteria bacterium]|nr:methyltransferase domain-containing protein [Deltaproteobacteria bacterium]